MFLTCTQTCHCSYLFSKINHDVIGFIIYFFFKSKIVWTSIHCVLSRKPWKYFFFSCSAAKIKKKYQNFNETNAIQNKNVLRFFAKIPHMLIWSMVCPAGQEFLILNSVLIKHMLTLKEKKIINSKSLKKNDYFMM